MNREHKQFTKEGIRVAIKCNSKHPVLLVIQKKSKTELGKTGRAKNCSVSHQDSRVFVVTERHSVPPSWDMVLLRRQECPVVRARGSKREIVKEP